jgi:hypothetical protein
VIKHEVRLLEFLKIEAINFLLCMRKADDAADPFQDVWTNTNLISHPPVQYTFPMQNKNSVVLDLTRILQKKGYAFNTYTSRFLCTYPCSSSTSCSASMFSVGISGGMSWEGETIYPPYLLDSSSLCITSCFTSCGFPKGRVCGLRRSRPEHCRGICFSRGLIWTAPEGHTLSSPVLRSRLCSRPARAPYRSS